MIKDLVNSKERVEEILAKYPSTRDCDKTLWLAYLVLFHDLRKKLGDGPYEIFKSIVLDKDTATSDSVTRLRRKFQEDGKYMGTRRKYKLKEEALVREMMGYK